MKLLILAILTMSGSVFGQTYQQQGEAGALSLQRIRRDNEARDGRNAQAAQEERAAAAERYNLKQAAQNAAIGAQEYAQIRREFKIQTPDGVPLMLNGGETFPVIRRDADYAALAVLGTTVTIPAANLYIAQPSDAAKQLYADASARLIADYSAAKARQRAAYWAGREKAAREASFDDSMRQIREQKEKSDQQAREGAAWLQRRQIQGQLDYLQSQQK